MPMVLRASDNPSGWAKSEEVPCSGGGAKLYVSVNHARPQGSWERAHCGKQLRRWRTDAFTMDWLIAQQRFAKLADHRRGQDMA